MSYGFRILTGTGNTVTYDENSPPPGYLLEEFDVALGATVSKDYSTSGCSILLPYAFTYVDPAIAKNRGYPKVVVSGLTLTVTNIHPYASSGWGGVVRVCVLGC